MKRIFLFLMFLNTQYLFLSAQDNISNDSLKILIFKVPYDTITVNALNTLGFRLRNKSTEKAKTYIQRADSISNVLNYIKGNASSKNMLGILSKNNGDYISALNYYSMSLNLREEIKDWRGMLGCYNNIGVVYKLQGAYNEALLSFEKALSILNDYLENPKLEAAIRNNIGISLTELGEYESALKQVDRSIQIRRDINHELGEANSLLSLGTIYLKLNNWNRSTECYNQSLNIFKKYNNENGQGKCFINLGNIYSYYGEYDKSLTYYTKALKLKDKLKKNEIATIYKNIGAVYKKKAQFDKSIEYTQKSIGLFTDTNNPKEFADLSYNLGVIYKETSKNKKALGYFLNTFQILDSLSNPFLYTNTLYNLTDIYSKLEQYDKAFEYGNKYNLFRDSLNENYKQALNYKLNLEEEQKKIELMEMKQKIQESENQKQHLLIKGLLGVLILSGLLVFSLFFVYHIQQKRKIAEKNGLLFKQQINELLHEQESKANYARLEGQDRERRRIAQDLHDRLGSMLSTIKLYFKAVDSKVIELQEVNRKQYYKATELLDEACEEVRKVAHNMESGIMQEFGLLEELKSLVSTIENTNQLEVELNTFGFKERVDSILEVKIYRILQELISNVLKHSEAVKLNIQLNRFDEVINILVEDNGIGFDKDNLMNDTSIGMGLKNVESRVLNLNGSINIDSGLGNGTTISIDIPHSNLIEN